MIVSFFFLGLPIGFYLGVVAGGGLLGVWIGNVISLTFGAIFTGLKILTVDWRRIVEEASQHEAPREGIGALKNSLLETRLCTLELLPEAPSARCAPLHALRSVEDPLLSGMPTSCACGR
mmetsp:Transcript_51112/g.164063  ORF Transcript_51112/g.164063 Transcript_51112/m.164063 type:complete len:120 (-) Transcript_51112:140-499(-)